LSLIRLSLSCYTLQGK